MLLLQLDVDVFLFLILTGFFCLFGHLLVELVSHQAAALHFAQLSLLLLLVVKQLVEFLDRSPFVFLGDLRVHFRKGRSLRRSHRHIISTSTTAH